MPLLSPGTLFCPVFPRWALQRATAPAHCCPSASALLFLELLYAFCSLSDPWWGAGMWRPVLTGPNPAVCTESEPECSPAGAEEESPGHRQGQREGGQPWGEGGCGGDPGEESLQPRWLSVSLYV